MTIYGCYVIKLYGTWLLHNWPSFTNNIIYYNHCYTIKGHNYIYWSHHLWSELWLITFFDLYIVDHVWPKVKLFMVWLSCSDHLWSVLWRSMIMFDQNNAYRTLKKQIQVGCNFGQLWYMHILYIDHKWLKIFCFWCKQIF